MNRSTWSASRIAAHSWADPRAMSYDRARSCGDRFPYPSAILRGIERGACETAPPCSCSLDEARQAGWWQGRGTPPPPDRRRGPHDGVGDRQVAWIALFSAMDRRRRRRRRRQRRRQRQPATTTATENLPGRWAYRRKLVNVAGIDPKIPAALRSPPPREKSKGLLPGGCGRDQIVIP